MNALQIAFAVPVVAAYLLIATFAGLTLGRLFRDAYDRDGPNAAFSLFLFVIACALLAATPIALRAGLERLS